MSRSLMPAPEGSTPVSPTGAPPLGHAAHTHAAVEFVGERAGAVRGCRQQCCLRRDCSRLCPPRPDRSQPSVIHAIQARAHSVFGGAQSGGGAGAAAGQHPCTHWSGRAAEVNKPHTVPPATAQHRSVAVRRRGAQPHSRTGQARPSPRLPLRLPLLARLLGAKASAGQTTLPPAL